jgi:hypothetical protein
MNTLLVSHPAPACILPIDHPARAVINSTKTDIRQTFNLHRHAPYPTGDDHDRMQADDCLSAPGGWE